MSGRLVFIRSLPRDAKIIILSHTLRSYSSAILAVSFPIYLSKIGASSLLIGLTFMGIGFFSAVRSLVEGIVADKVGRRPILVFIAFTLVAGGLIYSTTLNLTVLLISAVIFTVGGSITFTPAELALLSETVTDTDRTMAFSVNALLWNIAAIAGSFSAGMPDLLTRFGFPEIVSYQQVFVIFSVVGAVCLFLFFIINETRSKPAREEAIENREDHSEREFLLKWSGVVALDQIGGSFNTLINYWYYLRFSVGPAEIGTLTGVMSIISSLSYALGYRMAGRFGTIRATVMSRIPIFIINLATPFMPSFMIVGAFRLFMSVFSNIDVPLRQSYIMGVTRSSLRASAYGVVQVVSRFTSAGAPAITGYLYQYVSLALPFYGAGLFQAASAATMYIFFKDIRPPEEEAKMKAES